MNENIPILFHFLHFNNWMKLIGSFGSPYARKVRIVFAEKNIKVNFVLENVWVPETRITQSNPLGKIPCLVLDDGSSVVDSRVIAEYADSLNPVSSLIPSTPKERAVVKTWEAISDGLMDASILARLETSWRPADQQCPAWIDRQLGKVDESIKFMSRELGDKEWCYGNQLTLADISVGCALGYLLFRFPQISWQSQYPNLDRFYQKLMTRPSFQETLPK